MKFYGLSLLGIIGLLNFISQPGNDDDTVQVSCRLSYCNKTLKLFQFDGITFSEVQLAKFDSTGNTFTFQIPKSEPHFYYIGQRSDRSRPIILGTEEQINITGSCRDIRKLKINDSPLNAGYDALKARMDKMKRQAGQLMGQLRSVRSNPEVGKKLIAKMKKLDDEKLKLLDSLKQANPFFAKIASLNTYLSYQNNPGNYQDEIEYFANEYFRFADFSDKTYGQLPWVYEAFKSYTNTLSSVGLPVQTHLAYLKNSLKPIPTGSPAHKLALAGIISTLSRKNHSNLVTISKIFIENFKDSDPVVAANLEKEINKVKNFMLGGQAPGFSQQTPDGNELKLIDLRGKVLLLDFWASWCGPCRRENPNVVRLYNKYKDKGFDILSVSLDRKKDRWLQAIEKDGLDWHHVSDLKGWSNAVAQLYNVRAIPHTLLLDGKGKIIAKNLRGPALQKKLAEIFK